MKDTLVKDYIKRAEIRIKLLQLYLQEKDYADTVREAQEAVELLLKAVLRYIGAEVPKVHDVGKILKKFKDFLPPEIAENIGQIAEISKRLRKERELAFYGAHDFIPSEEYTCEEAEQAIKDAEFILDIVKKSLLKESKHHP